MINNIIKYASLITIFVISVSTQSFANGYGNNVTITNVTSGAIYGSVVIFSVSAVSGQPACQTNSFNFAFDSAAVGGEATLSLLLTAYAGQLTVSISGQGVCTVYTNGNIEDLRWLKLE